MYWKASYRDQPHSRPDRRGNPFWTFSGSFGWYKCGKITNLKLAYVGGLNFVGLMTPKQSVLV